MTDKLLEQLTQRVDTRTSLIALKEYLAGPGAKAAGVNPARVRELKKSPLYSTVLWRELLEEEDPKVRKNVAVIIGLIDEPKLADALMEAYRKEQILFVRSTYLKALGVYDVRAYEAELATRLDTLRQADFSEEETKHVAEEMRELRRLLPEGDCSGHPYHATDRPVEVYLTCSGEAKELLLAKVRELEPEGAEVWGNGVRVKSAKIEKLAAIRVYQDLLFPLNDRKSITKENIAKSINEGNLFEILALMHKNMTEPFRFRVYTHTLDAAAIAGRIEALSKGRLINSVSRYEIELRLIEKKDGTILSFVKFFTRNDNRFAYRRNVVATSMSPVRAAVVAELLRDYVRERAQILDPYCGVGTLLIERDKVSPAGNLYGTDIFGDAVKGGRDNASLAGTSVPMHFIHRNFYDFTHEYLFDEVLTQMPDFVKEEADKNYRLFFERVIALTDVGAMIAVDSRERGLVMKYIRLHKDKLRLVKDFVLQKKNDEALYVIERI